MTFKLISVENQTRTVVHKTAILFGINHPYFYFFLCFVPSVLIAFVVFILIGWLAPWEAGACLCIPL